MRVDLQYFSQEKTEKATPKKRKDTRKKGQVAKSSDVNTALILFSVFVFLFVYAEVAGEFMSDLFMQVYTDYTRMEVNITNVMAMFTEIIMQTGGMLLPMMLVVMVAGVFSNMIQVGVLFAPEAIKPKISKLNPFKGIKRIFSARALVELVKACLKISLVGCVTFGILWLYKDELLFLSLLDVRDGLYMVGWLTGIIGVTAALLLLLLSIPDYVYQRYDHEKQIRMSKKEVKDEHKKMEGDPLIKSKRRQRAQEVSMQRMMLEVPRADVVITNPTHFAIALRYEEAKMAAPQVVAKGADYMALRIRYTAKTNEVTLIENKWLARTLYNSTDIGQEIPDDLFQAVAEVLAYVYRIQRTAGTYG